MLTSCTYYTKLLLTMVITFHKLHYLDAWSGFEAAKLLHGRVGDSTTLVNSLSPKMMGMLLLPAAVT